MKRIVPAPDEESVWDYPRPPRVEEFNREIKVVFAGQTVAETKQARRILETSHPPVYYIPIEAVRAGVLQPTDRVTVCEWKGVARYFHVKVDDLMAENAAWAYHKPTAAFDAIRDHVAFYPQLMDACFVDSERVEAQPGDFYGGWVTKDIVGPFKGKPGTQSW